MGAAKNFKLHVLRKNGIAAKYNSQKNYDPFHDDAQSVIFGSLIVIFYANMR